MIFQNKTPYQMTLNKGEKRMIFLHHGRHVCWVAFVHWIWSRWLVWATAEGVVERLWSESDSESFELAVEFGSRFIFCGDRIHGADMGPIKYGKWLIDDEPGPIWPGIGILRSWDTLLSDDPRKSWYGEIRVLNSRIIFDFDGSGTSIELAIMFVICVRQSVKPFLYRPATSGE